MTSQMKALLKIGPGLAATALTDVPVPHPGPGQVRVAVRGTGICGTDLHILLDEFPTTPPVVMGHEVCGVVDEVGDSVPDAHLGRRVALETYYSTCGTCTHCRSGRPNLCADRRSIGSHANGGFAPYVVVPVTNLHDVADGVSLAAGSLYEPLACVAHCLCDPAVASPGDQALVIGPGAMGLLAAQVLRAQGAAVVVAGTPRDAQRLGTASTLGLRTVLSDELAEATPPLGFDVVAECSGSEAGVASALAAVRKGGHYVQVGLAGRPIAVDLDLVCLRELTVTSGFASTPESWARAEALVAGGHAVLDPLVTEVGPLSDWQRLFERTRSADGVKVVIDPGLEA